jgi:hypothetical protein
MNRRHLLCQGGAAAALALAGCSVLGGDGESTPTAEALEVSNLDYRAADDGSLVAIVTVSNTASEPVTGTLYVDVTVDGSADTRVRTVEVEAAGTVEITAEFDFSTEQFESGGGSLSTRWGYQAE